MNLKIAAWNLNHWQNKLWNKRAVTEAWDYLYEEIGADIVLATEMGPPEGVCPYPHVKWRPLGAIHQLNWGSGIASKFPLGDCAVGVPPEIAVASVETKGRVIKLVCMYALADKACKSAGYIPNLHRYFK